jgi:hypothetical protein
VRGVAGPVAWGKGLHGVGCHGCLQMRAIAQGAWQPFKSTTDALHV